MKRLGSKLGCSMPAPTSARVPPRRSWWNPASMADFRPEHSSTTCTARSAIRSGSQAGNVWRSVGVEHLGGAEVTGQAPAPVPRLHGDHGPDAPGHQRGDGQGPDGPGPDDHHRVTGSGTGAGDAVQGDRQGLGQGRLAGGEARGQGHQRGGPHQDVPGEGPVRAVDDGALLLTLGRLPLEAATAAAAAWRGTTDDRVTRRPRVHALA